MRRFRRRGQSEYDHTGDSDLDALFSASMEFGPDWYLDPDGLAADRLPHRPGAELAGMVASVVECRRSIEEHVLAAYLASGGKWGRGSDSAADQWIAETYPWMHRRSRKYAIRKAVYLAYRG